MSSRAIQFHYWPWSVIGCPRESISLGTEDDATIELPYYGSPLLSVPQDFSISTDARHEPFHPIGCPYYNGHFQLYRVPHAIASSRRTLGACSTMTLTFSHNGIRECVTVVPRGAVPGSLRDKGWLQKMVLEWGSFFDFCHQKAGLQRKGALSLPWEKKPACIREYGGDTSVQKRSLIVSIAEEMSQRVQELVHAARRMLVHERKLLPAAKAGEMDAGCMHWYFRQPGKTPIEKASSNRQRLKALSRRETFNTLENRVLKEFLQRCIRECQQYISVICSGKTDTGYAKEVGRYSSICSDLLKRPMWEDVGTLESGARPNYVLQNDARYRKIWELYQKLLRKQDEEDWMWAWQGNTWADICRLLLGTALFSMAKGRGFHVRGTPLARAACGFLGEQTQGNRILQGTDPGPFLLSGPHSKAVLEIVHADEMENHVPASSLGSTGGSMYFVIKPLRDLREKPAPARVIIVWPVHSLASTLKLNFYALKHSAESGLAQQNRFINSPSPVARLSGLVMTDVFPDDKPDFIDGVNTNLACLAADPCLWADNVDVLSVLLDDLFLKLLEKNDA